MWDLEQLPIKNEEFDAILSWGVVEHFVEGPHKVLREMYNALRPGGFLFITVPYRNMICRSPLLWILERTKRVFWIRKIFGKGEYKETFFEYTFGRKTFINILKSTGFLPLCIFPLSHEVGFVRYWNRHFYLFRRNPKFFCQSKTERWQGLTKTGNWICGLLKRISPWFTPDQIFCIAKRV